MLSQWGPTDSPTQHSEPLAKTPWGGSQQWQPPHNSADERREPEARGPGRCPQQPCSLPCHALLVGGSPEAWLPDGSRSRYEGNLGEACPRPPRLEPLSDTNPPHLSQSTNILLSTYYVLATSPGTVDAPKNKAKLLMLLRLTSVMSTWPCVGKSC